MQNLAHRSRLAAVRAYSTLRERLENMAEQPDRGDISITTVIIWVAVVTGALLIAGTISVVVSKYNGKLGGV
ncbi:hypothetical protein [Streptomyces sp. NPDC004286]|uniref:hypothetical protein n=1 Tax=Streptomyces sp. NPDC004286 TaxID=3364696 RepID=UPI0036904C67